MENDEEKLDFLTQGCSITKSEKSERVRRLSDCTVCNLVMVLFLLLGAPPFFDLVVGAGVMKCMFFFFLFPFVESSSLMFLIKCNCRSVMLLLFHAILS